MDPILPALALGGALVAGYIYDRWRARYWLGIAEDCGLQEVKISGLAWSMKLQGQAGPLKVRFAGSSHNKGGTQVVVVIPGPPGFFEVSVRREYQAPWKTHELEVGSDFFDQTFYVQGPERLVRSMLDAEARNRLLSANDALTTVGSRLEIAGGELLVETVDRQLSRILPRLLRAGRWLAQPVDVKERLVQNATRDPEAGVRVENLLLLAREFPGDEKILQILRDAAYSDRSPELRLRAGRALGEEGRGVLLALAENLEDDAVSARAFSFLERELPFESVKAILLRALSSRRPQTAIACLEALGRDGDAPAVGLLIEVMEQQQGEVAVCAARALETTRSPAAEGPLVRALYRKQKDLQIVAASVLGHHGSTAAVLPLQEASARFSWDPDISRALSQAIAQIQSRLPGASPGQLSIAGAEVGQLSLAQGEAGQLSLATDPAGQISISDAEDKPGEV